jgi:hypothetical protein
MSIRFRYQIIDDTKFDRSKFVQYLFLEEFNESVRTYSFLLYFDVERIIVTNSTDQVQLLSFDSTVRFTKY